MANLRLLPGSNELDLAGGRLNFVAGADEVRQALATRLALVKGEWFLDPDAGLPVFDRLLGRVSIAVAKNEVRKIILGTAGVTGIRSLDVKLDAATRALSIKFEVSTPYGAVSGA